jgi:hypothetical protein
MLFLIGEPEMVMMSIYLPTSTVPSYSLMLIKYAVLVVVHVGLT